MEGALTSVTYRKYFTLLSILSCFLFFMFLLFLVHDQFYSKRARILVITLAF